MISVCECTNCLTKNKVCVQVGIESEAVDLCFQCLELLLAEFKDSGITCYQERPFGTVSFPEGKPEIPGTFTPYTKTAPLWAAFMVVPFEVFTLEGTMKGKAGDFLAVGIHGECYPITAEILKASHKALLEPATQRQLDFPRQIDRVLELSKGIFEPGKKVDDDSRGTKSPAHPTASTETSHKEGEKNCE